MLTRTGLGFRIELPKAAQPTIRNAKVKTFRGGFWKIGNFADRPMIGIMDVNPHRFDFFPCQFPRPLSISSSLSVRIGSFVPGIPEFSRNQLPCPSKQSSGVSEESGNICLDHGIFSAKNRKLLIPRKSIPDFVLDSMNSSKSIAVLTGE